MSKNPKDFFMIGGGQKEVSADDLATKIMGIRVHCTFKNEEREVDDTRPIYEIPLMDAMWRKTGGEAIITPVWLPARMKHSRLFPMSEDILRTEAKRLDMTYRLPLPNGQFVRYFNEIYGKDGDPVDGFYRVVAKQGKMWNDIRDKLAKEVDSGRPRRDISLDELMDIYNIAIPKAKFATAQGIDMVSDIELPDDGIQMAGGAESISDPLAGLRRHLTADDFGMEVVMELLTAMGSGNPPDVQMIGALSSLNGRKGDQKRLLKSVGEWLDKETSPSPLAVG